MTVSSRLGAVANINPIDTSRMIRASQVACNLLDAEQSPPHLVLPPTARSAGCAFGY